MHQDDQRNFLLAMVLIIGFMFTYQVFVAGPQSAKRQAAIEAQVASQAQTTATPTAPSETIAPVALLSTAEAAISASAPGERVEIDGARLSGSLRVKGARLDDVVLKDHFLTTAREEPLRLLRPNNARSAFYGAWLWWGEDALLTPIAADWEVIADIEHGAVLRYESNGVRIDRTITLDENYLFTYSDTLTNTSSAPKNVSALGYVRRFGDWEQFIKDTDPGARKNSGIGLRGIVGTLNGKREARNYANLQKGKDLKGADENGEIESANGGWVGFTDKYWMAGLIPDQSRPFVVSEQYTEAGARPMLEVQARSNAMTIPAGGSIVVDNHLFAGAIELTVLRDYQARYNIPSLDDAVDWGYIFFLTKPFFGVLVWLKGLLGSFGWAILGFTVLVKMVLFPLYNMSYKSMAKLKLLAEPMKEVRERFASDPKRQQQEIMALYKRENANPISGCLPLIATIPVFYALFHILSVTIEMRHTGFWFLTDLSAPDPTAILNLGGLIPIAAADLKAIPLIGIVLGIGFLPVLYGITMWAIQVLSPPPPDPTQRQIMMFLPLIFTFVMSTFAAGLLLYWVWNNILQFCQQYIIMRRNGVEIGFEKYFLKLKSFFSSNSKPE